MSVDPKLQSSWDSVLEKVKRYYPDADFEILKKAFEFARTYHGSQKRSSGEAYIFHPVAVADILAELQLDVYSIATGLLHDTVEDCDTNVGEVENQFGKEIALLVDGVTKLSKVKFKSSHEKQAENFRKMLLAMAQDLRVILVKLADRTHNMRTLSHLKAEKQMRISQETLDIYAPLANRLGISWMKSELEDLSLKYLHPETYQKLSALIAQKKHEREEYINKMLQLIGEKINNYGLEVNVTGRAKHFYSIFKKMETQKIDFNEIHDIVAFRVITKKISECYEVLGIVHSFFKPVPGRFKDYIAMPKKNLYQSLHTTVVGPFGERLEIQIRTDDMHTIAEHGVAAHWEYKSGRIHEKDAQKFHWLRQLVENQESLDNPSEFLESVKLDLFMGDIYVFSPKGDILEFPVGSTPLDFAYTIHTDLGHQCVGARVNGRMVPLKHKLRSGDSVEILNSSNQRPNKDWLKFVKTSRAKTKIRAYIRQEERDRAKELGRDLLDREFRRYGESLNKFEKRKDIDNFTGKLSFASYDEMLISLGYGKAIADKLVVKLLPDKHPVEEEKKKVTFLESLVKKAQKKQTKRKRPLVRIEGFNDEFLIRFGKCCNPLPGDEIIGYISRGRGVTVHKMDCPRILDLDPNRAVDVDWNTESEGQFYRAVKIRVFCTDESGLLNQMSQVIANSGINIKSLNIRVNAEKKATGIFDLEVKNKDQLRNCLQQLERLTGVISVDRI